MINIKEQEIIDFLINKINNVKIKQSPEHEKYKVAAIIEFLWEMDLINSKKLQKVLNMIQN